MHIHIRHETIYRYEHPPRRIVQLLRLEPPSCDGQAVSDWAINLNVDADLVRGRDAYGNITHLLTVERPEEKLRIIAEGAVETSDTHGVMSGLPDPLPPAVHLQPTELTLPNTRISKFAQDAVTGADEPLEKAHALLKAIHERMTFQPDSTDVTTTAAEAFDAQKGVCQDLAHLFCAASRSLGMPARYVSGHLLRRDGENDQPASHAWAEAWTGADLGWVSFDPAHGISTDEHYVRVASGNDYRNAAPIAGNRMGGGSESLTVSASTHSGQRQQQSQGRAMRQSQSAGSLDINVDQEQQGKERT